MLKRNQIVTIAGLFLLILGVTIYLVFFHKNGKDFTPAAYAMPETATIIWQGTDAFKNYQDIEKNDLFKVFLNNKNVKSFENDFRYFDSIVSVKEAFKDAFAKKQIIASLHITSANNYQALFLCQMQDDIDAKKFESVLKEVSSGIVIDERVFHGHKIYDTRDATKQNIFSFTILDGIFGISRNAVLVEDAIATFDNSGHRKVALIKRMAELKDKNKVFINYLDFPSLINVFAANDYQNNINSIKDAATFGEYDWDVSGQKIALTGTVKVSKDNNNFLTPLLKQKPQSVTLAKILPARTSLYLIWGVSDFKQYYIDYQVYLDKTNALDAYKSHVTEIEGRQNLSIQNDFINVIGNEWCYALLQPLNEQQPLNEVLIVKPTDIEKWKQRLQQVGHADNGIKVLPAPYREYPVYKAQFEGVFELVFGKLFSGFKQPFYTQIGDAIVFADSLMTVQQCIDGYLDNQTLAGTETYKNFAGSMGSQSNFQAFVSPGKSLSIANHFLRPDLNQTFRDNYYIYRSMSAIGYQLSSNGDDFFSQITAMHGSNEKQGTENLWTLPIEANILGSPYVFTNPASKEKEIVVADQNSNIYLISNSGIVRWKKKLDENVQGEVFQVDLYKNEQAEYLFATKSKFYLVDHDGNDVANYPISSAAPVKDNFAMFDFGNMKEYEYYVGTENSKIYGYYIDGKPIPGWGPQNIDAPLSTSLKAVTIKTKTYLFGVTDKGTLYIWNKDGNKTVKPIPLKTKFINPFKIVFGASLQECTFVSVDTNGVLYFVKPDGKTETKKYPGVSGKAFYDFIDTDGDSKKEHVVSTKGQVYAYSTGDPATNWNFKTADTISYAPQFFFINGKTWVGYVNKNTNHIYLQSRAGTMYSGFPLSGNTPFVIDDMNNDGEYEIVVGSADNTLHLYKLGNE